LITIDLFYELIGSDDLKKKKKKEKKPNLINRKSFFLLLIFLLRQRMEDPRKSRGLLNILLKKKVLFTFLRQQLIRIIDSGTLGRIVS